MTTAPATSVPYTSKISSFLIPVEGTDEGCVDHGVGFAVSPQVRCAFSICHDKTVDRCRFVYVRLIGNHQEAICCLGPIIICGGRPSTRIMAVTRGNIEFDNGTVWLSGKNCSEHLIVGFSIVLFSIVQHCNSGEEVLSIGSPVE